MTNNEFSEKLQALSKKFLAITNQFCESPVIATKASTSQLTAIKAYALQREQEIQLIQSFYEHYGISQVFFSQESSLRLYNRLNPKNIIKLLEGNFKFFKKILEKNYSGFMQYFFEYSERNINEFFKKKETVFSKSPEDSNFLIPLFFSLATLKSIEHSSQQQLENFLKHHHGNIHFHRIINTHSQTIATLPQNTDQTKIFYTLFESLDETLKEVVEKYEEYGRLLEEEPLSPQLAQLYASIQNKLAYFDNIYKKLWMRCEWYAKLERTEQEELLSLKISTEFEMDDIQLQELPSQQIHPHIKDHPIMENLKKMKKDFESIKIDLYLVFEHAHEYEKISDFKIYVDFMINNLITKRNEITSFSRELFSINKLFMINDRFFAAQKRELSALQKTETEMSLQNGANPV